MATLKDIAVGVAAFAVVWLPVIAAAWVIQYAIHRERWWLIPLACFPFVAIILSILYSDYFGRRV
jgi:hypothetical protein